MTIKMIESKTSNFHKDVVMPTDGHYYVKVFCGRSERKEESI